MRDESEGVVFDEPWQARAFAIAMALGRGGRYDWETFRQRLINAIGQDASARAGYYVSWLVALETLLDERGILLHDQIERRAEEIESAATDARHKR